MEKIENMRKDCVSPNRMSTKFYPAIKKGPEDLKRVIIYTKLQESRVNQQK